MTTNSPTPLSAPTITLRPAVCADAPALARLIMMAMSDDCCRHFYGPAHTSADFLRVMTALCARRGTQYSYENAVVAVANTADGAEEVAGCAVAYAGSALLRLREPFIVAAREAFGRDFSAMRPEAAAGEYYLDSLAVLPDWRGRGMATALIDAAAERARQAGEGPLTLLVDTDNAAAQRLYRRCSFQFAAEDEWGGHRMLRLARRTLS